MEKFPPILVSDTNYLLHYPDIEIEPWKVPGLFIFIPETVEEELKWLTRDKDPELSASARRAVKKLEEFRRNLSTSEEGKPGVKVRFKARLLDPLPPLDMSVNDHQIIATAYRLGHTAGVDFCAILSNDKELCDIAEALNILAISRNSDTRFHEEIFRKWEWSCRRGEVKQPEDRQEPPRHKPRERKGSHPGNPLEGYVGRLYRQLKAMSFRASLFLPSIRARIQLGLEIVRRQRDPKKEEVLIFLKDAETEQYWAGEIRQQGGFTLNEAVIFGQSQAEQINHARIVFYQHSQIIQHLPQHMTRLAQSKKKVLVLVDGSDLLDPVELAVLLYGCDRFVGLSHLPWNDAEARGRKILNAVLHNRALPDVSFAEAEREGWGHSCDLYPVPVEFTLDERQEWDKINASFIRLREKISAEFQRRGTVNDFWEELMRRLARSIDTDAAELIRLREQREQMAQQAFGKLNCLVQLFQELPAEHRRQILFDFNRLWTRVLLKELPQAGLKPVELPADPESQRKVWESFCSNKVDTLIISSLPPYDLPVAPFRHLVLITPLQPMDEMISAIDWANTHVATPNALGIHVLYVKDSPEELASLALVEAGFH